MTEQVKICIAVPVRFISFNASRIHEKKKGVSMPVFTFKRYTL